MEKKIKVMIIDDSSTIRRSAELFLNNAGFMVKSVEDGYDALSAIIDEEPDLIFIDVLMPKMDGLQTCQLVKRNPQFKNIPIIFLSSKDGEFDKARGLMMGANDYLTKPFTKESIVSIVNKYTASN